MPLGPKGCCRRSTDDRRGPRLPPRDFPYIDQAKLHAAPPFRRMWRPGILSQPESLAAYVGFNRNIAFVAKFFGAILGAKGRAARSQDGVALRCIPAKART